MYKNLIISLLLFSSSESESESLLLLFIFSADIPIFISLSLKSLFISFIIDLISSVILLIFSNSLNLLTLDSISILFNFLSVLIIFFK